MRIALYSVLFALLTVTAYAQTVSVIDSNGPTIQRVDDTTYSETVTVNKTINDLKSQCAGYQSQIDSLQLEIDRRTEQLQNLKDAMAQCSQQVNEVQAVLSGPVSSLGAATAVGTNWEDTTMIGN